MLYVHGGLVRTGTTSLQTALVAHEADLAATGILYPERWRLPGGVNHHRVIELLSSGDPERARQGFRNDLEMLSSSAVLISSESLSYKLAGPSRDSVLRLLGEARQALPVTTIWTLRNLVDVLGSLYLRQIIVNHTDPPPPNRFLRESTAFPRWPETSFLGLRTIAERFDTVLLRYERDGAHQAELLKAIGTPPALVASIVGQMQREPRLNVRLSHKGAVAILNAERISARAGVSLDRQGLGRLFFRDEFRFEDDGPCRLFDPAIERELHERALAAARRCGFRPYVDFFAEDQLDGGAPASTDPEVLSDGDLERLAEALRAHPKASGPAC